MHLGYLIADALGEGNDTEGSVERIVEEVKAYVAVRLTSSNTTRVITTDVQTFCRIFFNLASEPSEFKAAW